MSNVLKIAIVGGFGLMASPMARHLKGVPGISIVAVHDRGGSDERRAKVRREWLECGARLAGSFEELFVADKIDGVFVCCGKNGDDISIVAQLAKLLGKKSNQAFICHLSTVSVGFAEIVTKLSAAQGVKYVNYPLTGGPKGAEEAKMLILASGEREIYQRLEVLLNHIGKPRYFGERAGLSASVKLIGHLSVFFGLLGISSAVATQSEVFEDGNIGGASQVAFFDFLNGGAGHTRQWELSLRRGVNDKIWDDGFHIKYAVVDAIYLLELLKEKKVSRVVFDCVVRVTLAFAYVLNKHGLNMATHAIMRELIANNASELDIFIDQAVNGAGSCTELINRCIQALPLHVKDSVLIDNLENGWGESLAKCQ